MHHLLLPAQAWWDAQRFDQPQWQVAAWHDQKVRHIHLHVAKALGKVVAMLDEAAPPTLGTALQERVRNEVLPDVAIYRSQLINVLPDGWALPVSMYRNSLDAESQTGEPWWHVVLCLSRASAELASYLEPREHGVSSSTSHLMQAIEHLHVRPQHSPPLSGSIWRGHTGLVWKPYWALRCPRRSLMRRTQIRETRLHPAVLLMSYHWD
jgi:hypothetical protein